MTLALLGQFRAEWLDGPLPMIVEHSDAPSEDICAAPSLWMGGKRVCDGLRARGLGPGHRVRYLGASRAGWVQTLLGCLRAGACFECASPEEHEAWESSGPNATVDSALDVAVDEAAPRAADPTVRLAFRDGALTEEDIDALAQDAATLLDGPHGRLGSLGDWGEWRVFASELLGGLRRRMEIHVLGASVRAERLAEKDCLPEVLLGESLARLAHDPLFGRDMGLQIELSHQDEVERAEGRTRRGVVSQRPPRIRLAART